MRRKIKGQEGLTTSLWGVLGHDPPPPAWGEGAGGVGTPPLACGEGAGGGSDPPPSMWCAEKCAPLPGCDVRLLHRTLQALAPVMGYLMAAQRVGALRHTHWT